MGASLQWIVVVLMLFAARLAAEVTVDRKPPDVQRKSFEPAHPPEEMPPLRGREAAVTRSEFQCGVVLSYRVLSHHQQDGRCATSLKVQGVTVTLQLNVAIWLPSSSTRKLSSHEEGHRRIAEQVYENAEQTARTIGQSLVGKTLTGTGSDCDAAEAQATQAAANEFCQEYLSRTARPAETVGEIYDQITAHGTKAEPAEDEAIRQAFEQAKRNE